METGAPTYEELIKQNERLRAALERIYAGETMLGKIDYTLAEVVVKYQQIAGDALKVSK
jgi:hypothetical protein